MLELVRTRARTRAARASPRCESSSTPNATAANTSIVSRANSSRTSTAPAPRRAAPPRAGARRRSACVAVTRARSARSRLAPRMRAPTLRWQRHVGPSDVMMLLSPRSWPRRARARARALLVVVEVVAQHVPEHLGPRGRRSRSRRAARAAGSGSPTSRRRSARARLDEEVGEAPHLARDAQQAAWVGTERPSSCGVEAASRAGHVRATKTARRSSAARGHDHSRDATANAACMGGQRAAAAAARSTRDLGELARNRSETPGGVIASDAARSRSCDDRAGEQWLPGPRGRAGARAHRCLRERDAQQGRLLLARRRALRALPNPFGVASEAELSVLAARASGCSAPSPSSASTSRSTGCAARASGRSSPCTAPAGARATSIERLARAAPTPTRATARGCCARRRAGARARVRRAHRARGARGALARERVLRRSRTRSRTSTPLWPRAHEYHHRHTPTSFSDGLARTAVDLLFWARARGRRRRARASRGAARRPRSTPWRFVENRDLVPAPDARDPLDRAEAPRARASPRSRRSTRRSAAAATSGTTSCRSRTRTRSSGCFGCDAHAESGVDRVRVRSSPRARLCGAARTSASCARAGDEVLADDAACRPPCRGQRAPRRAPTGVFAGERALIVLATGGQPPALARRERAPLHARAQLAGVHAGRRVPKRAAARNRSRVHAAQRRRVLRRAERARDELVTNARRSPPPRARGGAPRRGGGGVARALARPSHPSRAAPRAMPARGARDVERAAARAGRRDADRGEEARVVRADEARGRERARRARRATRSRTPR